MSGNSSSGRPPKVKELEMIERLSPLDDQAFEELKKGIERGEFAYLKLFFNFRFGRPKQIQDVTINSEQPLFNLDSLPNIFFKKTQS